MAFRTILDDYIEAANKELKAAQEETEAANKKAEAANKKAKAANKKAEAEKKKAETTKEALEKEEQRIIIIIQNLKKLQFPNENIAAILNLPLERVEQVS